MRVLAILLQLSPESKEASQIALDFLECRWESQVDLALVRHRGIENWELSWWRWILHCQLFFLISSKTSGKQLTVLGSSSGFCSHISIYTKKQATICFKVFFVGFGLSWNTKTIRLLFSFRIICTYSRFITCVHIIAVFITHVFTPIDTIPFLVNSKVMLTLA